MPPKIQTFIVIVRNISQGYPWENAHICNAISPFQDEPSDIQALKCLLNLGADVNALDRQLFPGFTPLHHAVLREKLAVAKFLLTLNLRLDLKDTDGGRTPLEFAQQLAEHGNSRAVAIRDLLVDAANGVARLDDYEQMAADSRAALQARQREAKGRLSKMRDQIWQGVARDA